MHQLGTLEELPLSYRDELTENNLVPLWPNMRAVLPPHVPSRNTLQINWPYKIVRPLLIQAGELTPMEKAERRVLVLANPGHGLSNMQATPSIYLGLQLILPGETAPNHRHTPNAVRIIIEGEGAYTTVNGEQCKMERGDLILTPSGKWHEHHHDGNGPIVWLDVLDLPLIYRLEGSWALEGEPQVTEREKDKSYAEYSAAGIVPNINAVRADTDTPMLRYPWQKTKACLEEMAKNHAEGLLSVSYVNPETGASLFPSIGFGAIMIRPGETAVIPKRTAPSIFHIIEGQGSVTIGGKTLQWSEKDTLSSQGYEEIVWKNASTDKPVFIITADETPLHRYLRIF